MRVGARQSDRESISGLYTTYSIDECAVLGRVFPRNVVIQLDRVGLVVLDRETRVDDERREFLPFHRSVAVYVNLSKEFAEIRNKLLLGECVQAGVLVCVGCVAHEPHHDVDELGDRQASVFLLEFFSKRADL